MMVFLAKPMRAADSAVVSQDQVRPAVQRLQSWYDPQTGLWKTTGWWNSANALTALIDDSRVSHTDEYLPTIAATYSANIHSKFLNQYYDDEGWWALAWIDAWDLTRNPAYLATAASIFQDMTGGWDQTCGGGIWWNKERHYKNAIANELFLSVAAHLANRTQDPGQRAEFVSWANREWAWFRHTGMIEHDHLISDGLTPQCKDNHGRKWTYNQGVILGGLTELSRFSQHREALRDATHIANAAIARLTDADGILHEPCEPACGADGTQFKGIFVRNLAALNQQRPADRYRKFILANAAGILARDQTADHALGLVWSGPPGKADASTQSSALDALIAALQLEQEAHSQ